jgi:site-specific recombinase XerD
MPISGTKMARNAIRKTHEKQSTVNEARLPSPTLATEVLTPWLQDLSADRSAATARRYASAVRRFLRWYQTQEHQPLQIDHLTPIVLVGYRNALQRTEATSTVNTHVCALRAFATWLVSTGHLASNPAGRFKFVARQDSPAPQALTDSQVHALLRAAARSRHPLRDTAILQMLLQTGMRIGECAALTWEDITFGEKRGVVTIRAGKGNKARSVPLNASVRQALADYAAPRLGVLPTLKGVAGAWPDRGSGQAPAPLWRSQKGGQLSVSAIGRMIDGLVQVCATRGLVPATASAHTLRHTFATRYLMTHPADLVSVAALLGHSSLNTTRIYVQPTAEQLAERVEQVDLNAYAR